MSFAVKLRVAAGLIEAHLLSVLSTRANVPMVDAMRYAVCGGKRMRGFLVLEGAAMLGVPAEAAIGAAAAVEAMHAYSLVHDDLPCMDNDAMRRGMPTVHVKWDQATAVLAGDALQPLAFELLSDPTLGSAHVCMTLSAGLAKASGAEGMVLGQALDIAAETSKVSLTLTQITELQAGKTGALITWAATAGAVMAGADTRPLRAYGDALGLAFQIADDVLDVEGDAGKTGKRVNKDAAAGKATFVSLLGMDAAKARARALVDEACAALQPYGDAAGHLKAAAHFAITREN